jgi:hypothetical protein
MKMNLKFCLAAVAVAAGVAAGVPATAGVSVVQVPSTTLVRGSTYAWGPIAGIVSGTPAPALVNEITIQRLETETNSALSSKGYRLVTDPSEADLIITYNVLMETGIDANLDAQNVGCGPVCPGGTDYRLLTSKKTQGTLVLDLYDRRTGSLLYRATSEKEISSKDASAKRLGSVLKQMTKSLPS